MKIVDASPDFKAEGFIGAVEVDRIDEAKIESMLGEEAADDIIIFARSRGGIGGIIRDQGAGEMILIQVDEGGSQYLFPVDELKDSLEDFFLG